MLWESSCRGGEHNRLRSSPPSSSSVHPPLCKARQQTPGPSNFSGVAPNAEVPSTDGIWVAERNFHPRNLASGTGSWKRLWNTDILLLGSQPSGGYGSSGPIFLHYSGQKWNLCPTELGGRERNVVWIQYHKVLFFLMDLIRFAWMDFFTCIKISFLLSFLPYFLPSFANFLKYF